MKKFLVFIVAVFALCSCAKDDENYTGIPDGTYVEDMSRYSVYDLNQMDPKILTILNSILQIQMLYLMMKYSGHLMGLN